MRRTMLLAFVLMAASPAVGQDIVGLEDCAQARGTDKKIGCLQSNVDFLHRLIRKNDDAAQERLRQEGAKLAAATARLDELRAEIDRIRTTLDQLPKPAPQAAPSAERKPAQPQ
jgi:hypothetical protein